MSWMSSLAPVLGAGLGYALALPTGGMSVTAGAMLGGTLGMGVSSAMSADEALKAQESANQTNVDLTRETNSQQIELANTAHQREVKDLAAAGLNPILSSKYGGSATPGLTAPQVQSAASTISSTAAEGRANALSTQSLIADIAVKKSQVLANSAQAVKAGAEAQSVFNENDLFEFTRDLKMKGAYNAATADLISSRNRAKDEGFRSNRPDWLRSVGIGWNDLLHVGHGTSGR